MNTQYTIGQIVDVRIEKIVPLGFGIGFTERLTVMVPLAVPGDELRVELREIKKRLAFAEIIEVIKPGPVRIVPPCEYVGRCGGCDFQQMEYAAQLAAKIGIIRDCLHRIAKIEYEGEISVIPSPLEFGYRSRARWQIDGETRALGYFRRDSHDVIDIASCPILTPELDSMLGRVRNSIDWAGVGSRRTQIEAAVGPDTEASIYSYDHEEPPTDLSYSIAGESYSYSAGTFFQANKLLIGDLIETAVGGTSGAMAFDLYCGVGLFSLPLARRFGTVIAVEGDPGAVAYAKRNVAAAGLDNVKVSGKSVEQFLAQNKTTDVDLVLIDPPRSGTEKNTILKIAALKPAHISYVSCEPSILARDLRTLIDLGYRIDRMTAVDLFPQTHHIETVVRLSR